MEHILINIDIKRYDDLFEKWVADNNVYIDQYNYPKCLSKFDDSLGLEMAPHENQTEEFAYIFKIKDGPKFFLAQIEHVFSK